MKIRNKQGRYISSTPIIVTYLIITNLLLIAGASSFYYWQQYNQWYCTNSAILNIAPIGLPTSCPITSEVRPKWANTKPKGIDVTGFSIIRSLRKNALPLNKKQVTVAGKIKQAFGGGQLGKQATKVAYCESSLSPQAKNPHSSATGLFQIMAVHGVSQRMLLDEDINIAVAKKLYDEQGWTPWNASRHCWVNNY